MSSVQFTQEGLSTERVGFWFELTFSGQRGIPSVDTWEKDMWAGQSHDRN